MLPLSLSLSLSLFLSSLRQTRDVVVDTDSRAASLSCVKRHTVVVVFNNNN